MHQAGRGTPVFEPPDEHGYIRSLSPAIGVQLVKDQEPQSAACTIKEPLVLRPNKQHSSAMT
jgi:hypothetical protein